MSSVIDSIEQKQLRKRPSFDAGDRVRVHFQVTEGSRKRTQVFDGVVLKLQGSGARETFTVRKQSFGVGVERTFPLHSPKIEKIEVASRGDVRRAKLYYLRDRVGRRARVRERVFTGEQAEQFAETEMSDAQGLQEEAAPVPADGEVPVEGEGAPEGEAAEGAAETAPAEGDAAAAESEDAAEGASSDGEGESEAVAEEAAEAPDSAEAESADPPGEAEPE
jgi:large subunit ribosomal protein L19